MNPYLRLDGAEMWHIAGWTMVHFVWLGALVGLVAAVLRLVLRRASPNLRYAAAAASLALLAVLPLGIAGWLATKSPPFHGGMRGGFLRAGEYARNALAMPNATVGTDSVAEFDVHSADLSRETVVLQTAGDAVGGAAEPFPGRSLNGRGNAAAVVESFIAYLPWVWLVGTPLTLVLLTTGIIGTERLRRASQSIAAGPIVEACTRLAQSMQVGRRVMIATCDRVCAPVLVGILRPMILLPPAALTGWSPDEIEMVLLHELAHVRRWDNLVNLLQRLVESLLFFHPAVWLASNWMRRDRETCCDAIVVTRTKRPHAYAELLVALAAQIPRSVLFHPAASSAMAARPLRSRIRRILQLEDDYMLVTGKSFALVLAGLLSAATLAVLYLPARGRAEEAATEVTEGTQTSEEKAELVARSLKKLQDEIRQKWEDFLEIAESGDRPEATERNTKTDLLISEISNLRKQKSDLEKQMFQLQTDFRINKSRIDDPQLIDLQVEEALAEDTQYMLLKQQLKELQMVLSGQGRNGRSRDATALNQHVAQVNAQIQQYKAQIERDRRTKPNLMLQQLQKEFQTNAQLAQLQLAGINKALEEAMDALSKRQPISIDLEQRDLELKRLQEIANDMTIKLATLEIEESADVADEESAIVTTEDKPESEENEESIAEEGGENETQIDSPPDEAVSSAEDDWLRDADFASQREREIAQRAWKELGFKAVPLTETELEEVRRGGIRGGLKLIGLEEVMNTQGPLILTHIQSKRLATGIGDFASLERALDALASQPPDDLLVLQGIKPRGGIFQYSMRRPQEKSARSTIAGAPDADGQAKAESVSSSAAKKSSRGVQVEQVRVGDENVTVVRGSQDDVNAFVKQTEAGENRETQNERRVLGTFSPDVGGQEELFRAADEARAQNLYVDFAQDQDKLKLLVVPAPREADWPAMLGDPPRKDRVIADKAWERLGLKVVPASDLEQFDFHSRRKAGPIKILGGNVPKGLPLPAFLRRIGGNDLDSFNDLHTWLINEEGKRPQPVKVYAFANGHEYLFEAGPVDDEKAAPAQGPAAKFPSLEDQKLADLAWQMLQLELEPTGNEELKQVRALGYQGGVMVTGTARPDSRRLSYNEINPGDVLVGLHVWPTTSLKDVAAILTRDDLSDLNPLKFHVWRGEDLVVTGRITVRSPGTQLSGLSQLDAADRVGKNSTASAGDLSGYVRQSGDKPPAASNNEIKVLREHIKTLQSQFDRIDALFKARQRGGRASTRSLAAYELAAAKGELALMQRQHAEAVYRFHEAQSLAEEAFKAMSADYEAGNTTYDVVLLTAKNLADIRRKIIQLEQERTAPNRAAAAGAEPATSFAAPEAGGPANSPATSAAPEPNQSRSPNKRRDAGVTISAESQEALDEFMRLASSPQPGDSMSVLKKIVEREKQKYDRMVELVKNGRVTQAEAETQRANYEISMERLRQADRALEYYKAQVQLAAAEYEAALEASKQSPRAVSELELRKLQLKVQLAEAKLKELAE